MSVVDCVNSNEPSDWTGLSFSQQRLWLFQQLNPQSKAYNLGGLLWIDGELDVIKLESTIETIRQQQEILRAQFTEVDGIPCQRSAPYIYQKLVFINLEHHSEAVSEAQFLARELWLERFDLESGPLIRWCLYKVAENKHALLISGHHILVDAWSLQLVIKQIISGLSDKQLKVRKSQNYFSYAQEQRDWLASSDAQSEFADFHKSVNYDSARLTLPRLNDLQQDTYTASHYCPEFSYELNDTVSRKAKQLGCSKFTLLLAGLQLTMNTWSSEGSPTLCVPNFNRNSANRRSLGFYVNNMALNTTFSPLMTTEEWIDLCKNNLDKAQKHQHLPLELIDNNEEQVNAQVAFNFRSHGDGLTQTSDGLFIRFEEFEVSETPFEIVLDVISSEQLSCRFVYATELYSANVMKQFSNHYFKMIDLLCLPETTTLAEIELFDDEERDTLNSFATQPHYWEYQPLPLLIQQQAELRPDAIALVHGDERLSYQALEHQANQLSHYLIEQGVSADMPVGVAFERGNTMLVAMLAVLKAGGAFLPLDPAYPNERLSFMLEDSGVDLLLTDSKLTAQVPCPHGIKSVYLDQQMMGSYSTDTPDVEFHQQQLAYLIYTSGSTGKPKGVALTHAGLSMHVQTIGERYGMTPDDVELHFASISFDGAVERWAVPLAFGSRLVIRDQALWSAEKTCDVLVQEGVTIACFPPSYVGPLLDWINYSKPNLIVRSWTLGGEAFTRETYDRLQQVLKPQRIINGYGPTETVVTPMIWEAYAETELSSAYAPIGTAVGERRLYILDPQLNRVPLGMSGELYIGAEVGLARGYHGRADLTAERFLPDPYGVAGDRMYRTGDLVRWRDDGVMEYLGRIDQQIKIRGFRVELGEIESKLQLLSGAEHCAVVAHEAPGGKRLVGYLQQTDKAQITEFNENVLLQRLAVELPDYMVPATLVVLAKLPLTPAGKIDRQNLLAPNWHELDDASYIAPEGETEALLSQLWKTLLGVELVGRESNFFALGGDSILALQLVSHVRQAGLLLTPKDIFDKPILTDMACCILVSNDIPADQSELQGSAKVNAVQQRFLTHYGSVNCNQYLHFELNEQLVPSLLKKAIYALIQHHDSLRLCFKQTEDGWDCDHLSIDQASFVFQERQLDNHIGEYVNDLQQALNIEKGCLLGALYLADDVNPQFILTIHHLAVDAYSWRVLLEDLMHAYQQLALKENIQLANKTHSLNDWASALSNRSVSAKALNYWQAQDNIESLFELGDDSGISTSQWTVENTTLADWTLQAKTYARLNLEELLLLIMVESLFAFTERDLVRLHRESHGRFGDEYGLDLSRSVGWFTSLYPQVFKGHIDFETRLKQTKEQLRKVELGGLDYSASIQQGLMTSSDSIDVLFNFLGKVSSHEHDALKLKESGLWRAIDCQADAAIVLNAQLTHHGLALNFEFDNAAFTAEQRNDFIALFQQQCAIVVSHFDANTPLLTPSDVALSGLDQASLDLITDIPEDIWPLSSLQQGLLFHGELATGNSSYINQLALPMHALDPSKLMNAWASLMQRHPILRASVLNNQGTDFLAIWPLCELPFVEVDLRFDVDIATSIKQLRERRITQGFELNKGPLWRIDLLRIAEHDYICILTLHHVLMDGWSTGILFSELLGLYAGDHFSRSADSFDQYLMWLNQSDADAASTFWQQYLSDIESPTQLAVSYGGSDYSKETEEDGFQRYNLDFTALQTSAFESQLKPQGLTLNTLMQGAWTLTLGTLSRQTNPVFGNTVSGRPTELLGSDAMVGLFINTLPMTVAIEPNALVLDWLHTLQREGVAQREFSYSSLAQIQQDSGWAGESLFDTLVVFENYPLDEALFKQNKSGLQLGEPDSYEFTHYPLTLAILPGECLRIVFAYDQTKFSASQIENIAELMALNLNNLVSNPQQTLASLTSVPESTLVQLNRFVTQSHSWNYEALPLLIQKQAQLRPDAIALVHGNERLSYRMLEVQANQLSHYLIAQGVGTDVPVGVAFERGNCMLVAMLAVLKSGGAFLPLDPSYPSERLNYMLADSGVKLLLTHSLLAETIVSPKGIKHVYLDQQLMTDYPTDAPSVDYHPQQLAYLIYTSGSTGRPKGVALTQAGLSMHVQTIGERYGMTPDDVELHFASISFDGAVERWAVPLAFGSRLVIRDQALWSAEKTCQVLEQEGVTIACFPPSYVGPLLDWIAYNKPELTVRSWTLGGEAFTRETYERLQQVLHPQRVINGYGPTETVVTPMIWEAYAETELKSAYAPIGTAVGERRLYILDNELNRLPVGVSGELYIGAEVGLARGYHGRADLTAERFLPDPYGIAGERMYRTGDLVRWRRDGVMEYLGRVDQQIKIRGFRIELGEIESKLQQLSRVEHCAVVAHDAPGGKRLVAYLQQSEGALGSLDEAMLLRSLVEVLPDYMVPAKIVVLNKLPLTPAGKIDRQNLFAPNWTQLNDTEFKAPEGDVEELLSQVWQRLLGVERVGRDSNFFALGGHSLLAMRLVGELDQKYQLALPLQAIFDSPVLADMAFKCVVKNSSKEVIVAVDRDQSILASAAQRRLWFMHQLEPTSAAFHMPLALEFKGELNIPLLQQALNRLLMRHEVLRTNFIHEQGEVLQSINPHAELVLTLGYMDRAQATVNFAELLVLPFDLENDLLVRAKLVCLAENHYQFLLVQHHIISDGISTQLLLNELSDDYALMLDSEKPVLEVSALQYADFSHWQKDWLLSEKVESQLTWWKEALVADIEPLNLYPESHSSELYSQGERYHFELSSNQVNAIQSLASEQNTTTFNVLLTLWQLLLHKYTQQDEIRIGVPVSGRSQNQTQAMQGCFINSIVIPARFSDELSFSTLLEQVSAFSSGALQNQDLPFEMLVAEIGPKGNLQQHPLYQSSFNLQRIDKSFLQNWTGLDVTTFDPGAGGAQLDLSMDMQQFDDGSWAGFFNYAVDLFSANYIARLHGHWQHLLVQVTATPSIAVSQLTLITKSEQVAISQMNATQYDWGGFKPLAVTIHEQALLTPDAIAVSMGEQQISYAQFEQRVNQLAHYLQAKGVGPEVRVAIGLPRSVNLVIGIHAITRAGGAYVPLDPSYPSERLSYILQSADVGLLLTDVETQGLWSEQETLEVITLDNLNLAAYAKQPPSVAWHPDQALYVIYTSGSTGLPKGVVNTQGALQNRLNWKQQHYALQASDCVLQKTPFSFDVSVWEFFWPLMFGARLAIAPPDAHRTPWQLQETMANEGVTTVHFVPSMLQAFIHDAALSQCRQLRQIICSGEALPAGLSNTVLTQAPHIALHNLYGPTEAAIDVSYWQCQLDSEQRVPIGFAIANTELHVLDDRLYPVPIGVPGELYLAGYGLAREYMNRADLTADRFIPNPFGQAGSRMYRTGDQVVRRVDGALEYLGRLDHQVKIRGLRIELEEIESLLVKNSIISDAAVVVHNAPAGDQLIAYLVCAQLDNSVELSVKKYLAEHLPDYMVPSLFIGIEHMPLSPNGKRDRKALPTPVLQNKGYQAPETELEIWLAASWSRLLELETVSLDDNFFALGGHSLLATRVIATAREELSIEINLRDFFNASDLRTLADLLEPEFIRNHQQEHLELDEMAMLLDELEAL